MTWIPDYSDPIFGLGEAAEDLQKILFQPRWARRRWLRTSDRFESGLIYRYQDFVPGNCLSMKKAEDLLVESRLFLPSPSSFNDPYEFQARITLHKDPVERRAYFRKVGKRVGLKGAQLNSALTEFIRRTADDPYAMDKILQQQKEKWGIACFSLNPRSLRMWSHYSAGHSGVCLQFDLVEDPGFATQTMSVNYQPEMATLHWPGDSHKLADDVLLRKWDVWKEEEEVRYTSKTVVNGHLPLSPAFLSGIILGSRFPDSAMPALDEYLRRRKFRSYRKLRLFRADRYPDRYGIYIRRLASGELAHLPNA